MAETAKEVWVLRGRRFLDGKVQYVHHSETEPARELIFGKPIVGSNVGGRYEVSANREDDTVRVTPGQYSYLGAIDDDARRREWVALDATAVTEKERAARERKDKETVTLDDLTLRELRLLAVKMLPQQRRALIATVIERMVSVR